VKKGGIPDDFCRGWDARQFGVWDSAEIDVETVGHCAENAPQFDPSSGANVEKFSAIRAHQAAW
jgi:hypothetical protein